MRSSRGQTIVEAAIAVPVVLLVMFAILYVAKLGVVVERTELAIRYNAINAFETGTSSAYGTAKIYNFYLTNAPACGAPNLSAFSQSAPLPGPSTPPYFQPDIAPTGNCSVVPWGFGGSQFMATHYFEQQQVTVGAGVNVPSYLRPALGTGVTTTSSTETMTHPADPSMLLYCSTEVRQRVSDALTAGGTVTLPSALPGTPVAPAPPNNNGACE